jgi:hypothetical protein
MKRPGDKRMYLVEFDSKRRLPSVTPVWGQRSNFGLVTFTRFHRDDRLWDVSTAIFETELEAWRHIEQQARETLKEAKAAITRMKRFMPHVRRQITKHSKLSNPKKRARR